MNLALCFFIVLLFSGCAENFSFGMAGGMAPIGFFYGVWHGMIAPFAWLYSLFSDSIAIYAIYNNGGWYDFGFILGIGGLTSSSSTAVKRR